MNDEYLMKDYVRYCTVQDTLLAEFIGNYIGRHGRRLGYPLHRIACI